MSELRDAIQRGIDKVNHREDLIIEDCGYSYFSKGKELDGVALRQVLSLIREGLSAMLPPEKDHIAEPSKKIVEIKEISDAEDSALFVADMFAEEKKK